MAWSLIKMIRKYRIHLFFQSEDLLLLLLELALGFLGFEEAPVTNESMGPREGPGAGGGYTI